MTIKRGRPRQARYVVVTVLGLVCGVAAGALMASNMGFKLEYDLDGPGGLSESLTGTQTISLPYHPQAGLDSGADVFADLPPERVTFSRFVKTNNGVHNYAGNNGDVDFPLVPGEGYFVTVEADAMYVIVGSHDPSLEVTLDAPGTNGSFTGTTLYSYPYHSVATTADELRMEINAFVGDPGRVSSIGRLTKSNNGVQYYSGLLADANFPLVPGEAYFITVTADTTFVPAHY